MSARDEILGRIREAAWVATPPDIPTTYRRSWDAGRSVRCARFVERLAAYGVTVVRATAPGEIAGLATARLAHHGARSVLVPTDLPLDWRPENAAADAGQDAHALDGIDAVMTSCAVAIAETGTIVLDGGAGQGRRAITLVPDLYICVVLAEQVVGIVPEAIARLRDAAEAGRPITFISGPSATADIELQRVAGVHGPRRLDVILVEAGEPGREAG